jgi:hypothetical protein
LKWTGRQIKNLNERGRRIVHKVFEGGEEVETMSTDYVSVILAMKEGQEEVRKYSILRGKGVVGQRDAGEMETADGAGLLRRWEEMAPGPLGGICLGEVNILSTFLGLFQVFWLVVFVLVLF